LTFFSLAMCETTRNASSITYNKEKGTETTLNELFSTWARSSKSIIRFFAILEV
jgi:hypothetical protein